MFTAYVVDGTEGCRRQDGGIVGTSAWVLESFVQLIDDVGAMVEKLSVCPGLNALRRKPGGKTQRHQCFEVHVVLQSKGPQQGEVRIRMAVNGKCTTMLWSPYLNVWKSMSAPNTTIVTANSQYRAIRGTNGVGSIGQLLKGSTGGLCTRIDVDERALR